MENAKDLVGAIWRTGTGVSAYLGSGGTGDVFAVTVENEDYALKLSKFNRSKRLRPEYDTLKRAFCGWSSSSRSGQLD